MIGVFDPSRADVVLTIESQTQSRDSNGGIVKTWVKHKTCNAERLRRTGGESIQVNQQVASMPTDYRIRHDSSVTATMRCFEGFDDGTNPRYYLTDVRQMKREGITELSAERRDNAEV